MEDIKIAFDSISRVLAITRYDIEQHILINDQSLNIHGENWFRDIFNFVYDLNLTNANFESSNTPAIDLVDNSKNLAYQITSTRTKEKVDNTLSKIKTTKYKDYKLKIFFLLEKAKFNKNSIDYFKDKYGIDVEDYLLDYTDLLKDIEALTSDKIIELNKKYFTINTDRYTEEIVLNLIFKHLLKEKQSIKIDHDEDFGTIDTNKKLELNNINKRISTGINIGLDYRSVVDEFCTEDNLMTDLRNIIIDDLYKKILFEALEKKISKVELLNKKTFELQDLANNHQIDFNKLINKLHQAIENMTEIKDFNTMNIAWIIIAYFFEICDVGVDE